MQSQFWLHFARLLRLGADDDSPHTYRSNVQFTLATERSKSCFVPVPPFRGGRRRYMRRETRRGGEEGSRRCKSSSSSQLTRSLVSGSGSKWTDRERVVDVEHPGIKFGFLVFSFSVRVRSSRLHVFTLTYIWLSCRWGGDLQAFDFLENCDGNGIYLCPTIVQMSIFDQSPWLWLLMWLYMTLCY